MIKGGVVLPYLGLCMDIDVCSGHEHNNTTIAITQRTQRTHNTLIPVHSHTMDGPHMC